MDRRAGWRRVLLQLDAARGELQRLQRLRRRGGARLRLVPASDIPEGYDRITLRTNHRIVYNDTTEYWPERELSITVRDTDGLVLGTVYGETLTRSTNGEIDRGWQKHVFDLSQYAGQTVQICFSETVPQNYAGPAMIEFDDISLSAEYLPSWALPDVDEYTLGLTGKAGHAIDIILAGQDGVAFSGELLELLDTDGVTVLATAVNNPLGEPAGSFDLGILDFTVPSDGIYTLRVTSWVEGRYGLVVTDAMVFDSESDAFRSLDKTDDALGYLGGQDDHDWYTITLAAGEVWVIHTETPLDGIAALPRNDLDPGLVVVAPNGQTVAADSASPPDGKNAGVCLVASADRIYRIGVTAESGQGEYLLHAAEGVNVLARRLFYNNSLADGNDPAANEADDQAIATDKLALLPGETASFANYSSYDRGINGVMIDIPAWPAAAHTVGSAISSSASAIPAIRRPGWPPRRRCRSPCGPARAIWFRSRDDPLGRPRDRRQWLQVTVKATDNTGLAASDVFYFGNAPGESGNAAGNAIVNATDEILARNFYHGVLDPAAINDPYDYNRDGLVNATDQIIARNHQTNPLTCCG